MVTAENCDDNLFLGKVAANVKVSWYRIRRQANSACSGRPARPAPPQQEGASLLLLMAPRPRLSCLHRHERRHFLFTETVAFSAHLVFPVRLLTSLCQCTVSSFPFRATFHPWPGYTIPSGISSSPSLFLLKIVLQRSLHTWKYVLQARPPQPQGG